MFDTHGSAFRMFATFFATILLAVGADAGGLGSSSLDVPKARITDEQLREAVEPFRSLKYESAGGGFVRARGDSFEVVRRDDEGRIRGHDRLGCSPFAHAILHRLRHGHYRNIEYAPQFEFGGAAIADHHELVSVGRWTVADFLDHRRPPGVPDGVYFFDLRTGSGWRDGRRTEFRRGEGMLGHVGFLAIAGEDMREYQFSDRVDGLAVGTPFLEYLGWSMYGRSGNRQTSQLELYVVGWDLENRNE